MHASKGGEGEPRAERGGPDFCAKESTMESLNIPTEVRSEKAKEVPRLSSSQVVMMTPVLQGQWRLLRVVWGFLPTWQ